MTNISGLLIGKKAKLIVTDEAYDFMLTGFIDEFQLDTNDMSCRICLAGRNPKYKKRKKKK